MMLHIISETDKFETSTIINVNKILRVDIQEFSSTVNLDGITYLIYLRFENPKEDKKYQLDKDKYEKFLRAFKYVLDNDKYLVLDLNTKIPKE